ncbi:MAG: NAD-dependent epimerase/dehydratase family protein [Deltaproteobacteria bacterium]|nr:NAD-dependent epimerase/dehydratase family protein [Deltaproteobacteria bacterium]
MANTILITGATGFLGGHLVRDLVRRGDGPVRAMQSGTAPRWLTELGVEVVRGSVTSAADVAAAVRGVDRVYHLAGFVSSKPGDAHRMHDVHVNGTRVLCQAAVAAGVRRIVMSSTSGTIAVSKHAQADLDEESPAPIELITRWPYYTSKLYQEEAARRACGDKVELVMLYPSLLLGPGDDRLSSTRTVLQFLGREIAMTPSGGLNFVDARDAAALFPVAMERGTPGARYLVGGTNWTFAEFFGRLERMTKVPAPMFKGRGKLPLFAAHAQAALYRTWGKSPTFEPASVDMAAHYWYFESAKAAAELGFVARDAADTLFDTVSYLRAHFLGSDVLVQTAGR